MAICGTMLLGISRDEATADVASWSLGYSTSLYVSLPSLSEGPGCSRAT